MDIFTSHSRDQYANLSWRQKPSKTRVFTQIFWSATWNWEWDRKSMDIKTSYVLISSGNYAGFTNFFSIFCWKGIDLKVFHAFGRISFRWLFFPFGCFIEKNIDLKCFQAFGLPFCWLPFELKFLVLAVSLSGNPKLWMRPIRFNTCNFCCIYLLNNKNLECWHTSITRRYTQDFHFSFQYSVAKVLTWKFSCFWSNLLSLAGFFLLSILSKKYWIEVFSSFWSSFLLAAFWVEVPSFSGQFERKSKT